MTRFVLLALVVAAGAGFPGTTAHPSAAGQAAPPATAALRNATASDESASSAGCRVDSPNSPGGVAVELHSPGRDR
jgi:hypothetical protein